MSTVVAEKLSTYQEERGKPMPSVNHGAVQTNLTLEFGKNSDFRIFNELTLSINGKPYTPDLSVYPRKPLDFRHDVSRCTEPPLMVVEILSPQQPVQDVMDKLDVYFAFGVKSVWVVSPPMRSIQIVTADGREAVLNSGTATDPATSLTANLAAVFS